MGLLGLFFACQAPQNTAAPEQTPPSLDFKLQLIRGNKSETEGQLRTMRWQLQDSILDYELAHSGSKARPDLNQRKRFILDEADLNLLRPLVSDSLLFEERAALIPQANIPAFKANEDFLEIEFEGAQGQKCHLQGHPRIVNSYAANQALFRLEQALIRLAAAKSR